MPSQLTSLPAPKPALFTTLDLHAILTAPRPVLDFVLPGLPAGTVGALVAPGATGKTTLALQLCAGVALGAQPLAGLFPRVQPGRAVLVTAEDPRPILANRVKDLADWLCGGGSAGDETLEMQRVVDVAAQLDANLTIALSRGMASLLVSRGEPQAAAVDDLVQLATGARLVVIDPLRRFHDGDENDSAAATALVQVIEAVARRSGAAVLLSHHTNKGSTLGGAGSEQQAARGSSALTDGVRWQANLRVMTEAEADALGVLQAHRRQYVRFDIPKSNYCAPHPGGWLRRGVGGMQTFCEFEPVTGSRTRPARNVRERGHA